MYASESYVTNAIANAQLGGGEVEIDLSGYATKDDLINKVDKETGKSLIADSEIERLSKVSNYNDTEIKNTLNSKANASDIPTKVSQLTNDKNYLTSVPSTYKTKTENDALYQAKGNYLTFIPSEYVTDSELNAKGYLTQHQDISNLAKKSELHSHSNKTLIDGITQTNIDNWNAKSNFSGNYNDLTNKPSIPTVPTNVSAFANDKGYLTSIPSEYITETELNNKGYLTQHQDISNLATKSEVAEIQDEIGEIEEDEDLTSLFNYYEGYLNTSGKQNTSSGAGCTDYISCSVGDLFIWSGTIDTKYNYAVCEYDANQTFISGDVLASTSYKATYNISYTVKKGKYVRFCSVDKTKARLIKTKEYFGINTIKDKTDEYMVNATANYANKTTGSLTSDNMSRTTDLIPVNSGDVFLVSCQARYSTCGVAYYNASKGFAGSGLCNSDSTAYVASSEQITVPTGVAYVRFGTYDYTKYPLSVQKLEQLGLKHSVKRLNDMMSNVQSGSNYLAGKKYVACGDSFTEGDFTNYTDEKGNSGKKSDAYDEEMQMYKTYPWWIAKRNDMTLVNEAKCGSDFTNIEGAQNPFSVSRYTAVPKDADYITIMFGLNETSIGNDASLIGTKEDATNTTLWGAYNIVFEYLITNMPYAKIGVIIADAWMTTNYSNAVKEICKYWGIPYLDLKDDDTIPLGIGGRNSSISSKAKSLRNSAFQVTSSDSHPNLKAHEYRSTIIENFMRSL